MFDGDVAQVGSRAKELLPIKRACSHTGYDTSRARELVRGVNSTLTRLYVHDWSEEGANSSSNGNGACERENLAIAQNQCLRGETDGLECKLMITTRFINPGGKSGYSTLSKRWACSRQSH